MGLHRRRSARAPAPASRCRRAASWPAGGRRDRRRGWASTASTRRPRVPAGSWPDSTCRSVWTRPGTPVRWTSARGHGLAVRLDEDASGGRAERVMAGLPRVVGGRGRGRTRDWTDRRSDGATCRPEDARRCPSGRPPRRDRRSGRARRRVIGATPAGSVAPCGGRDAQPANSRTGRPAHADVGPEQRAGERVVVRAPCPSRDVVMNSWSRPRPAEGAGGDLGGGQLHHLVQDAVGRVAVHRPRRRSAPPRRRPRRRRSARRDRRRRPARRTAAGRSARRPGRSRRRRRGGWRCRRSRRASRRGSTPGRWRS